MFKPSKYTNLEISIFSIAGEIYRLLKIGKALKFEYVYNIIINNKGVSAKEVYSEALSFLFLTNKIVYLKESDTLLYETQ